MGTIASDSIQLESIKSVNDTANNADSVATTANTTANTALSQANATASHFWYDSDGAHVTEVTAVEWADSSDPNYHSGGNTLITSTGLKVRDGLTDLATFGSTGVQIGQSSSGHTNIASSGMTVYGNAGSDLLANIGYGSGQDSGGGTSNAPFYTLGNRTGTVGNYSTAEGYGTEASGFASHAEGWQTTAEYNGSHAEGYGTTASDTGDHAEGTDTTASGGSSHAEGYDTTASGAYSHSEGENTTASNTTAHAEGWKSVATGVYSHAQNQWTKASSNAQTALGKYNVEDNADTYALIIGNGSDDNSRSNALTVDWSGNVVAGDYTGGDISCDDITATGDATITGDISADNITATTNITASGNISAVDGTFTGDVTVGNDLAVTSNITAVDITASGDVYGVDGIFSDTITVGRAPTSNMEVATKKYVDDNAGGGGGWTPTYTSLRTAISMTTTLTNYGNIDMTDCKYLEFCVYNNSYVTSFVVSIDTVQRKINNAYPTHTHVCRIGSTTYYFEWQYNDGTHIKMRTTSGSGIYVSVYGIK